MCTVYLSIIRITYPARRIRIRLVITYIIHTNRFKLLFFALLMCEQMTWCLSIKSLTINNNNYAL